MHVWILVLIAFWTAQPPDKPESVHTATAITNSAADCDALGQATASQLEQSKGVAKVGYACIETSNEADKTA
jgi:hypothetical protein